MPTLEEEMKHEMYKLEREIALVDDELEKLHTKILGLLSLRKKKEHDLRVLRTNFGLEEPESDVQITLEKILKERYMKA